MPRVPSLDSYLKSFGGQEKSQGATKLIDHNAGRNHQSNLDSKQTNRKNKSAHKRRPTISQKSYENWKKQPYFFSIETIYLHRYEGENKKHKRKHQTPNEAEPTKQPNM